jgi:gamma-glutamylcyclotransferase
MLHFAYGSNMLEARLRGIAAGAKKIGIARLGAFRLRFRKISADGSGKCDIERTGSAADAVLGVLYEIPEHHLRALEEHERGYRLTDIDVEMGGKTERASVFLALDHRIDESRTPYDRYREIVVAGANEAGVPREYIAQLEAVHAMKDRDSARAARARAVLGDAGSA